MSMEPITITESTTVLYQVDGPGWTDLQRACAQGRVVEVDELLSGEDEGGADPLDTCATSENLGGLMNSLHLASRMGHTEVVAKLLQQPITTSTTPATVVATAQRLCNVETSSGWTALELAANMGHLAVVKELESSGANLLHIGSSGSALHLASWSGHVEVAAFLLEKQNGLLNLRSPKDGRTALSMAAMKNRLGVLILLLEKGADHTIVDTNFGTTPLHAAADMGALEEIEKLIECGANINCLNLIQQTPLDNAIAGTCQEEDEPLKTRSYRAVEILLRSGADPSVGFPLLEAAQGGNVLLADRLLGLEKVDVNTERSDEAYLSLSEFLHTAELGSHVFCRTALNTACAYGHVGMVGFLLCKGADLRITEPISEKSGFHLAILHGHLKVVNYFLNKCNVKVILLLKDSSNATPLHDAIAGDGNKQQQEILEAILDRSEKADASTQQLVLGAKNTAGWTPLHVASDQGLLKIVGRLLDSGANVNAETDNSGETSLDLAVRNNHEEVVELLLGRNGKRGGGRREQVDEQQALQLNAATLEGTRSGTKKKQNRVVSSGSGGTNPATVPARKVHWCCNMCKCSCPSTTCVEQEPVSEATTFDGYSSILPPPTPSSSSSSSSGGEGGSSTGTSHLGVEMESVGGSSE